MKNERERDREVVRPCHADILCLIKDPVIQGSEIHREVIKSFGIGLLFKDQCSFTIDSGLKLERESVQKPC